MIDEGSMSVSILRRLTFHGNYVFSVFCREDSLLNGPCLMSSLQDRSIRLFSIGSALVIMASCSSADRIAAPASPQRRPSTLEYSGTTAREIPLTLPRGIAVPTGVILTEGPAPYDVMHEGPEPRIQISQQQVLPEDRARLNGPRGPRANNALGTLMIPPSVGPATDAHALYVADSGRGIYGTADAGRSISIPAGWDDALVYAPTHLAAGGSCIEITTIHWKTTTYHEPTNSLGLFDWCYAKNWKQI